MRPIHLVTYADGEDYLESANRLLETAIRSGQFASVDLWTRERVEATEWYRNNLEYQAILFSAKGAGYWAWKPLVFREALQKHRGNGYVLWHDAGRTRYRYWCRFTQALPWQEFIDTIQAEYGGLYAVPSTYQQKHWTKRKCFEEFHPDTPDNSFLPQFCAYFLLAQASSTATDFATEWLQYCSQKDLVDDSLHPESEWPCFREHRWEQSIMTALLYRYEAAGRIGLSLRHCYPPPTYRDLGLVMNSELRPNRGRRLHIGGTKRKEGWEVFNIVPGSHVDHVGDARDLSAFAAQTFSELYASHVLEHFSYTRDLNQVLKEWCRVLEPGGRLRLSVPNLETLAGLILDRKLSFKERFLAMRMIFGGQSNKYDFHHTGFTFEILSLYLTSNGFERIRVLPAFGLFSDASDKLLAEQRISLNVEAWKRQTATPDSQMR